VIQNKYLFTKGGQKVKARFRDNRKRK